NQAAAIAAGSTPLANIFGGPTTLFGTAPTTTANSYGNWGLPGQVNLPTFNASFVSASQLTALQAAGLNANASPFFFSGTFTTPISNGQLGSVVGSLGTASPAFLANRIAAHISPNFFTFNGLIANGGAFLTTNGADSNYHSLQVELRRRLSKGLLVQASYVWSHALTNYFASNQGNSSNLHTFANPGLDKAPSPFNIPQTLKFNMIYELPFGPGRKWSFSNGDIGSKIINKLVEGWEMAGIGRVQSGS